MKTEKVEQLMLLEESGELGLIGRWQLRRALAAQPKLAKFRDELRVLSEASRGVSLPGFDLPPAVLGEIRKAAAEQGEHTIPLDAIYGSWLRPAIALAAILVVVTGVGVVNHFQSPGVSQLAQARPAGWNDNFESELNSVSMMLAANFGTAADAAALDADSLARELLALEGITQ